MITPHFGRINSCSKTWPHHLPVWQDVQAKTIYVPSGIKSALGWILTSIDIDYIHRFLRKKSLHLTSAFYDGMDRTVQLDPVSYRATSYSKSDLTWFVWLDALSNTNYFTLCTACSFPARAVKNKKREIEKPSWLCRGVVDS